MRITIWDKIGEALSKYLFHPIAFGFRFVAKHINRFIIQPVWIVLGPVLKILFWPIDKLLDVLAKLPSFIIAILSAFIWGFGQLINRQYIKALIFFSIFLLIVLVEIGTGSYGQEFNLYDDKLSGEELEEEVSNYLVSWYYYNLDAVNPTSTYGYTDLTFLEHVAEVNGYTFDEATMTFYDENNVVKQVDNITYPNADLYAFLGEQLRIIEDAELEDGIEEIQEQADILAKADVQELAESRLLEIAERDVRTKEGYADSLEAMIETIAIEELVNDGNNETDPGFDTLLANYITSNYNQLEDDAFDRLAAEEFTLIYDEEYPSIEQAYMSVYYTGYYNNYVNDIYGDIVLNYDSIRAFKDMMQARLISPGLNMDNDDFNKMLIHIYYEYNPEAYETVVERTNNFFYERAGFFVKGVWGGITLGSTPQQTVFAHKILNFMLPQSGTQTIEAQTREIGGHHSTQLLLRGLITLITLSYVTVLFIWNIRDAYKTSKTIKETSHIPNEREYFANLYEEFFEYIVLTPALVLVSYVTIMPILFGLAVAFTNYNLSHLPPGQLVEWVGFRNFLQVFQLTDGATSIDFGGQFWRVFTWTVIWAFASTFTCFFGGFLQAVILNNKRVGFRKVWRSFLILPWAMPALISQMIFRVMFNDIGYVNQTLNRLGLYDLLFKWGMLGRPFNEAGSGIQRLLYLGYENIQWLTNEANPTFVKVFLIVLNIWLGFPFFMALMSGVMTSIDKSLYEAAAIDGATGFQQFRFITMPLVLIATSPLLIMTFSGNFNNFGVIYFITGGGPGTKTFENAYAGNTDILISWIYTLTTDLNVKMYNFASVFSILIFLIIGSVSAWNFTRTRAFKEDD
jgi:arabinogalactan oligomer/maltooligosaccharide transport system permease protein